MNNKEELIRQSNKITLAGQKLTKQQRDCLYMIIQQINIDDGLKKFDEPKDVYDISIPFENIKKIFPDMRKDRVKAAFTKLNGQVIDVYDSPSEFITVSLVTKIMYSATRRELVVRVDSSLMPFLTNLAKKFTMYNINTVTRLRSAYSQRMYELVCMFKRAGSFILTVDTMRRRFHLPMTTFKNFNNIKTKILDSAKRDLDKMFESGESDCSFSYELNSFVGKRVESIKFYVVSKRNLEGTAIKNTVNAIMDIIKKYSGRNMDYITFVENTLLSSSMDLEAMRKKLHALDKSKKITGALLYYILKSDYGIDYSASLKSEVDDYDQKFSNNKFVCEEEAMFYMNSIGLHTTKEIKRHISNKMAKGIELNDCETFLRDKFDKIPYESINVIRDPENRSVIKYKIDPYTGEIDSQESGW